VNEKLRELIARFWANVDKNGPIPTYKPELGPCWLWIGPTTTAPHGSYGELLSKVGRRRKLRAHRFSYELAKGPMPKGLVTDHLCRVTLCVNPDHLEAVTDKENVLRGHRITAINANKTHCVRGHRYTQENTYLIATKTPGLCHRKCKLCVRIAKREEWRRNHPQARRKEV
jgi:hypothetical protein